MSTCDPRDIMPGLGSYGAPGQMLVAGSGITISSGPTWQTLDLELTGNKDFQNMMSRIAGIEERLAILIPNHDLQERFPALQEAYDHYKLIEKLVNDQSKAAK